MPDRSGFDALNVALIPVEGVDEHGSLSAFRMNTSRVAVPIDGTQTKAKAAPRIARKRMILIRAAKDRREGFVRAFTPPA